MEGIIIYRGKYGATKQYATWLGEDLNLPVFASEEIAMEKIEPYNYLVIGSSVYIGKLQIRKWLFKNESYLKDKKIFFFQVAASPVKQIEKRTMYNESSIPAGLINKNSFFFLPGRIKMENLNWVDRLLLKMGSKLTKDLVEKKNMVTDFDNVSKESLNEIEAEISAFANIAYPANTV